MLVVGCWLLVVVVLVVVFVVVVDVVVVAVVVECYCILINIIVEPGRLIPPDCRAGILSQHK